MLHHAKKGRAGDAAPLQNVRAADGCGAAHSSLKSPPLQGHAGVAVIRAELIGSDTATAEGVTVTGSSPVLLLCRQLIRAGHDPAMPMHVFQGDALALIVRNIGEAARLEVNHHGTGFIARREWAAAPPIAPNAPASTGHQPMPGAAE